LAKADRGRPADKNNIMGNITMKAGLTIVLAFLTLGTWLNTSACADEKKGEVTLTGKICCGKCELELTKKCASVIVVKENGKDMIYWFDTEGNKKYHAETCSQARPGEVVGTVSEANGKKIVTVSKVTFKD